MAIVKNNRVLSPLKSWLAEFLFIRNLYTGPSSRPLYSYQVTTKEYADLRLVLTENRESAFHLRHDHAWAACFCLFVAECFRREYDSTEAGWAWSTFEKRIECTFSPQERAALVTSGLEAYWNRPIRNRERGRDLLGSLFAEGGLPWLLLQSDSHGFGRAVRNGLKHFYRAEHARRTTTDLIGDYEQSLPQTFRNFETRQLLAGVVEQLMYLAERYPLRDQKDPSEYLDKHSHGWRSAFPIPLDEKNARGLINEWLKDAGQRRQERKEEEDKALEFTCKHRLRGELNDWRIQTEVILPKQTDVSLVGLHLSSTRLELCFYEGTRLLAKGGVVYAQINDGVLVVRFPSTKISLDRRAPHESVTLHLLENGSPVHVFHFIYSALDYEDLPLTFEAQGDEWWFVSSGSLSLRGECARIRLPARFNHVSGDFKKLESDVLGGCWLEALETVQFSDGVDLITVALKQSCDAAMRPELQGAYAPYRSTPSTVFVGWPRLILQEGEQEKGLVQYANGTPVFSRLKGLASYIRYSIKNSNGETLLYKRFGVLPEDFQLSLHPASLDRPARLIIRPVGLHVRVVGHDIVATTSQTDQVTQLDLRAVGADIPVSFTLEISNNATDAPVMLHLPFPYQGARLIGADDKPLNENELTLDELVGLRIVLSSGLSYGQRFHLHMELMSRSEQRIRRSYIVEVGMVPVLLNLFSYQNDMAQMLGAVDEQDSYIRLNVETEQRLLSLDIRRYNGQLRWLSATTFEIVGSIPANFKSGAKAAAMLLSDPRQVPLCIPERMSEGVDTGIFSTVLAMDKGAPWLIYPEKETEVKFRPSLYIPTEKYQVANAESLPTLKPVSSLHEATRIFHPQHRPHVINEQITEMTVDLEHSGWQYLSDLKSHYAHLPLSTFESWRSLSRHPDALAMAVFRLEIDEAFCYRIRDELAVIWECIPLPLWAVIYQRYRQWLARQPLTEVVQERILDNRKQILPAVVSGFQHVGNYLETGDTHQLKMAPIGLVLPDWYQTLRRSHEANNHWPTELGSILSAWVKKQNLPASVKHLSQVEYSDAVTYLPIFMAYVTAGKACLTDTKTNSVFLKFSIKMVSDFDRSTWYTCVHDMMVSYLLSSDHRS